MNLSTLSKFLVIFSFSAVLNSFGGAYAATATPPLRVGSVSDQEIRQLENLHQRAEERILKNNFKDAIRIYEDILLQEPDDETAYTGLGQCYMVLGDFARAKNAYLNALHINPNNETALLGLKKIADPDSLNFTVLDTAKKSPQPDKEKIPDSTSDDIHLGAKKTMAPYSAPLPKPIQYLSREQLVQTALKNAGFYDGNVDGVLGPGTRSAIREFQKKYDLNVDGKAGPKTWALLQPYLNQNAFEAKSKKKS